MNAPRGVGIGLRREHALSIFDTDREVGWVEAIAENVIDHGGSLATAWARARERWPVAIHGVSLNLGGPDPLDEEHLTLVKKLLDTTDIDLFTDHLCWSKSHGHQSFDLLPLPFCGDMVRWVAGRIREVQDRLGRRIAVENVSAYARVPHGAVSGEDGLSDGAFHRAVCEEADCGLLLDVNNVYVNAVNFGTDPLETLLELPIERTAQMHIAGHLESTTPAGERLLLDDHGHPIVDPVFELLKATAERIDPVPVLLEWDQNVPDLDRVLDEADKVRGALPEAWR